MRAVTKVPDQRAALDDAYRGTDYAVLADPEVIFRVDATSPALAALLQNHGAQFAVLLTACNPFSRRQDGAQNALRNAELLRRIVATGARFVPAEARDPAGRWPIENGYFVFDIAPPTRDAWLVAFEQYAAVEVDASGMAGLVWHPEHRRDT